LLHSRRLRSLLVLCPSMLWRLDMARRPVPAISERGPRSVYVNSSIQT
jgi:hypothetical protein